MKRSQRSVKKKSKNPIKKKKEKEMNRQFTKDRRMVIRNIITTNREIQLKTKIKSLLIQWEEHISVNPWICYVDRDVVKKKKLSQSADGNAIWPNHYGNSITLLQKIKNSATIWPSISTSRYLLPRPQITHLKWHAHHYSLEHLGRFFLE